MQPLGRTIGVLSRTYRSNTAMKVTYAMDLAQPAALMGPTAKPDVSNETGKSPCLG